VSDHQGVETFFELMVLVCLRLIVMMLLMAMCKMEVEPVEGLDPTLADRVDATGCISFAVYPETSLLSSLLLSVSRFVKSCRLGSLNASSRRRTFTF
jgi:hypothetical protein